MKHTFLRHVPGLRLLVPRPRLAGGIAFGALVYALIPFVSSMHHVGRLLVGYNAGVLLYLIFAGRMMTTATISTMRRRALTQDEGKVAMMVAVVLSSLSSLLAIAVQLSVAKDLQGIDRIGHIALAGGTVLTSWTFAQVMFALHYAHEFYHARHGNQGGGLEFPGTDEPTYWDFLYCACVIGTSGQTADVAISSSAMRRFALVHCVLAYVFNTTLLALTINIAAGLL